jgi:hypothetical protein
MPGRPQHHRQREIHAPTQETHGHRRRSPPAEIAAEAEARFVIAANLAQAGAGLARIVGAVQNTAAPASDRVCLTGQLFINAQQQAEKVGRLQ